MSWPPAKATAKSLTGSSPIPKPRGGLGKSKPGQHILKSADQTATLKHWSCLRNLSGNSASPARTSKHGLMSSNWTTTSVSEARHERLPNKKQFKTKKDKTYEQQQWTKLGGQGRGGHWRFARNGAAITKRPLAQ